MLDLAFILLFVVVATIVEHYIFWPRLKARIASGYPGARWWGYRRAIVGQWLFAIAGLAIWSSRGRPLELMRFALPTGWRLALALVLVGLMTALTIVQIRSLRRVPPERYAAIRPKFGDALAIMPHTQAEYFGFLALSATAGFCEELLYRGYFAWFLSPWLGDVGGMLVVVLAFGLGHLYQGPRGAFKATMAGAVMAAIVLATGSLIPAMIIHALIDMGAGTVGYVVLRESPGDGVPTVPAIAA